MTEKIKILFLSANPWTTSRILVDEEEREIFEKLQEGPKRDKFELHRHAATRTIDLQRLLMMHEPHIVHFSAHGSKEQKLILGGKPGRGKQIDRDGLVQMFALYKSHVRLVVLNACCTSTQARSLSEVIDYSVGAEQGIDDKEGVAFAGAFYRALGFGKSIRAAFESAKAELALPKMPRTKGLELFVRNGVNENDSFLKADYDLSGEVDDSGTDGGLDSTQKETDLRALDLTQLDTKLSHTALASLRKAKLVKRTSSNVRADEIEPRSSVSSLHTYVSLTINVFKVALRDSRCIPQMRVARRDQARRKRARSVNKKLGNGKRAISMKRERQQKS